MCTLLALVPRSISHQPTTAISTVAPHKPTERPSLTAVSPSTRPQVDFEKFRELTGLGSVASGREMLRQAKKKLHEEHSSLLKDGAAGDVSLAATPKSRKRSQPDGATPTPRARRSTGKKTTTDRAVIKSELDFDDDELDVPTPTKKRKRAGTSDAKARARPEKVDEKMAGEGAATTDPPTELEAAPAAHSPLMYTFHDFGDEEVGGFDFA